MDIPTNRLPIPYSVVKHILLSLFSISPSHTRSADNAIKEMNRHEKEVLRAYERAVKYASHTESKTRIIITGDRATGEEHRSFFRFIGLTLLSLAYACVTL